MNEQEFKKHLADLARGHHHPEQHDWDKDSSVTGSVPAKKSSGRKKAAAKPPRKKK